MYQRVLLTIDGSRLSQAAVPHAAHVVAPGGDVRVITVVRQREQVRTDLMGSAHEFIVPGATDLDDLVAQVSETERQSAADVLKAAELELSALGVKPVHVAVREGHAGNAIIDAAHEYDSQVIVMGTRGHSGLGREVVGSVAEYVLRHAGEAAVLLIGTRGGVRR